MMALFLHSHNFRDFKIGLSVVTKLELFTFSQKGIFYRYKKQFLYFFKKNRYLLLKNVKKQKECFKNDFLEKVETMIFFHKQTQ